MAWSMSGRYFENCTCNVVCPCTASFALGADFDRCVVILAFHVDEGTVDEVDVTGLTVALIADAPKIMTDGGWRMGIVIDDAATDQQTDKLGSVFSGALGGPPAALGPLVGEMLGVERAPVTFTSTGGAHRLDLGHLGTIEVSDVVPFGIETGEPARLTGVFHPAGSELVIGKAGESRLTVFGLEPALAGQAGFSSAFAWSA